MVITGVAGIDLEIVIGVEPEVGAIEQPHLVAVGRVAVEFAGEGNAAAGERDRLAILIGQREAGWLAEHT